MSVNHERLPRSLIPVHYQLHIYDIDVKSLSFKGAVSIELSIEELTSELLLNSANLAIDSVSARVPGAEIGVANYKTDDGTEILAVDFEKELSTSDGKLSVDIRYTGKIQENMSGFYVSEFTDELTSAPSSCLSTQFEAASARWAFPCLDEPSLKATFGIELTVQNDWIGLSNMPVLTKTAGERETKYVFEKSVKMSTYLVAWACGDFEYIETFTERLYSGKKIPVRCYTTRGLKDRGELGLSVAAKAIDYFSGVFDIDYPLPKLDLISIPTYSHGAMENYGLITFRATALLYDPKTSDAKYQQNVAYVVAHECAHQWFGNLVTMNWWNELWLNEGFATWVGYLAISHIYPEWDIFTKFVSGFLQSALTLDSLRGSHPVEVAIHSVSETAQVFDAISYTKGASIINMLSYALGTDVFLKGVSNYLKKHKYGNATTSDLWDGITESSGIDINKLMGSWINKIGFPYLDVSTTAEGKVAIAQKRFLASGDVTESEDETIWWVPLNISTGPHSNDVLKLKDGNESLLERTSELSIDGFFKLNKDSFGFYRVCYEPKLLQNIFDNIDKFSIRDKVGLLADVASTATASLSKTSSLLELVDSLKGEDSFVCWDQIIQRLSVIEKTWFEQPEEVQLALKEFQKSVFGPAIKRLGFTNNDSDSYLTKALRTDLLSAAGAVGVPEVVDYAVELFSHWEKTGQIEPSLRSYIFCTILSDPNATEKQYEAVLREVTAPSSIDAKEIALSALGKLTNKALITKVFELLKTDTIPLMDVHFFGAAVGGNNTARWMLWEFLKGNFDVLYKKLSANIVVWNRFFKISLESLASEHARSEISEFFKDKSTEGFDRTLSQVLDQVKTNSSWVERDAEDVKQWLERKRYL